jgi:amino-acid N-acetyltransferase
MIRHPRIVLRSGTPGDAQRIHALIEDNLDGGRLLPRELGEVVSHSSRFVVAVHRRKIVGCAELAPLSHNVAEVRSLAVDRRARGKGIGAMLVEELQRRARLEEYSQLGAFTHAPGYFAKLGFLAVPHAWLPEEVSRNSAGCCRGGTCVRIAVVMSLEVTSTAMEHQDPVSTSPHI